MTNRTQLYDAHTRAHNLADEISCLLYETSDRQEPDELWAGYCREDVAREFAAVAKVLGYRVERITEAERAEVTA